MRDFEGNNPDTDSTHDIVGANEDIAQKIGSGALFIGNYDPADSLTYAEVQELMADPSEIRATPGPKRSFL